MTCIVGMVDEKGVTIGADSLGVGGLYKEVREDTKVFTVGEFIIGYTSSFRMGQLLRFKLDCAEQKQSQSDYEYMCTTFVDTVRECLKAGGFSSISSNTETGGTFLVGYKGVLYTVYNDYQVGIASRGYSACGCGDAYALGSIHHSVNNYKPNSTKKIIIDALKSAEYFSAGVGGPFKTIFQKKVK